MILSPQVTMSNLEETLSYYMQAYGEVHLVTCDKCGADLAIEVRGNVPGYSPNEQGFVVLPLGEALLSSRIRTDGVFGYQCGNLVANPAYAKAAEQAKKDHERAVKVYDREYARTTKGLKNVVKPAYEPPVYQPPTEPEFVFCMNDTRSNPIEEQVSPTGSFLPHEVAAIHKHYADVKYRPDITTVGNKQRHETFTRTRIK